MKCPYCNEELGINNICINAICSHFGTTVNPLIDCKLNELTEDDSKSEYVNNNISNCNSDYNNLNTTHYNKNSNEDINNSTSSALNFYNNISEKDFIAFIRTNTGYYLDYIPKFKTNSKFLSWNWSCFLLSSYWFLYRKLYIPAAGLIFFNLVSSQLFRLRTYFFIVLIMHIIMAIIGNSVYLSNCANKIRNIKKTASNLNRSEYINKLHKKGGTNLLLPLILLVIYILGAIIYSIILITTTINQPNLNSPSYYF